MQGRSNVILPSASDPSISINEETNRAELESRWHNKARLVDRDGKITEFHSIGFSERDRVDLLVLMATPERLLDSKRIIDCLHEHFFETNFWFEWCTIFAFERWHSAIEFKRYLLRFLHHFSTIDTQEGVYRTRYSQYDSIAVPLMTWLRSKGVEVRFEALVNDVGFAAHGTEITVDAITCVEAGIEKTIPVGRDDFAFVTVGSMTADKTFGSMTSAPRIDRSKTSGAWRLWETMAQGRPLFGNPSVFDDHVEESVWESFTVTVSDPTFFRLMKEFSGSDAGKGGLITFKDSSWLITMSIYHQPYYQHQPEGVFVWWGYGLFYNRLGDFVSKTMAECTGAEILEEVLGHLHFQETKDVIIASSNVIPCMMPYITSQFLVRKAGDRPDVVPDGSTNLAFLGLT